MFGISVYKQVNNSLLLSQISKLISTHRDRHTRGVHGGRCPTIRNCDSTKAFHYDFDICLWYALGLS